MRGTLIWRAGIEYARSWIASRVNCEKRQDNSPRRGGPVRESDQKTSKKAVPLSRLPARSNKSGLAFYFWHWDALRFGRISGRHCAVCFNSSLSRVASSSSLHGVSIPCPITYQPSCSSRVRYSPEVSSSTLSENINLVMFSTLSSWQQ